MKTKQTPRKSIRVTATITFPLIWTLIAPNLCKCPLAWVWVVRSHRYLTIEWECCRAIPRGAIWVHKSLLIIRFWWILIRRSIIASHPPTWCNSVFTTALSTKKLFRNRYSIKLITKNQMKKWSMWLSRLNQIWWVCSHRRLVMRWQRRLIILRGFKGASCRRILGQHLKPKEGHQSLKSPRCQKALSKARSTRRNVWTTAAPANIKRASPRCEVAKWVKLN